MEGVVGKTDESYETCCQQNLLKTCCWSFPFFFFSRFLFLPQRFWTTHMKYCRRFVIKMEVSYRRNEISINVWNGIWYHHVSSPCQGFIERFELWPLDGYPNLSLIQFPPLRSWDTFSLKKDNVTLPKPPWWKRIIFLLGSCCLHSYHWNLNRMLTWCASWILGAFIKSSGHNGAKYCVCLACRRGLFWSQMHWHQKSFPRRGAIQITHGIIHVLSTQLLYQNQISFKAWFFH